MVPPLAPAPGGLMPVMCEQKGSAGALPAAAAVRNWYAQTLPTQFVIASPRSRLVYEYTYEMNTQLEATWPPAFAFAAHASASCEQLWRLCDMPTPVHGHPPERKQVSLLRFTTMPGRKQSLSTTMVGIDRTLHSRVSRLHEDVAGPPRRRKRRMRASSHCLRPV